MRLNSPQRLFRRFFDGGFGETAPPKETVHASHPKGVRALKQGGPR